MDFEVTFVNPEIEAASQMLKPIMNQHPKLSSGSSSTSEHSCYRNKITVLMIKV